ncbi:hypothetical protein PsAD46_05232 [Pseudovibrio sp. Ad46]|uniref:hypothetical protein n=1 Tax=Pseudovibrio sp. Ad46 TaxID=989432 RepID=UPI0007AE6C44|nr:hypothetical protein [Pseudovibrio sp. Ad46]KZK76810.1 hypothetical protein PsAD46_05232 [Pseudovibrio sp. Ad46]
MLKPILKIGISCLWVILPGAAIADVEVTFKRCISEAPRAEVRIQILKEDSDPMPLEFDALVSNIEARMSKKLEGACAPIPFTVNKFNCLARGEDLPADFDEVAFEIREIQHNDYMYSNRFDCDSN